MNGRAGTWWVRGLMLLAGCASAPTPTTSRPPAAAAEMSTDPQPPASAALPRVRGEAELQAALADDPRDVGPYEELARLYHARSLRAPTYALLAAKVVEQGLIVVQREGRTSADLLTTRGLLALMAGRPDAAMRDLEAAVAIEPGLARAQLALGETAIRIHDFPRAVRALQAAAATREGREDPEVWLALGVAARGTEDLVAAEVAYRRSLALRPADPRPWFNLGHMYQQRAEQEGLRRREAEELKMASKRFFTRFVEATKDDPELAQKRLEAQDRLATLDQYFWFGGRPRVSLEEKAREMAALQEQLEAQDRARLLELEARALAAEAEAGR